MLIRARARARAWARKIIRPSRIIRYWDRVNELLDRKFPVDPLPAPQNELKPRLLKLTLEAKKNWIAFHDAIDRDLAEGKWLAPIRRFGSKAAEHVLRIAGVLGMTENPEVGQIEEVYIERGITLVEYYISERLRIQGHLAIPRDILLAQHLLSWCRSKCKQIVSVKEIYQFGPNEIRQVKKARAVMKTLEEHGWAIPCPGAEIDGRSCKEGWTIRPPLED